MELINHLLKKGVATMILFDQEISDDFPSFYSKVRLSDNQIKSLLQKYLEFDTVISIKVTIEETIRLTGMEAITLIMCQLKRNKVIELIHHLYLIDKRNSDTIEYLKFIILGIILNHKY